MGPFIPDAQAYNLVSTAVYIASAVDTCSVVDSYIIKGNKGIVSILFHAIENKCIMKSYAMTKGCTISGT